MDKNLVQLLFSYYLNVAQESPKHNSSNKNLIIALQQEYQQPKNDSNRCCACWCCYCALCFCYSWSISLNLCLLWIHLSFLVDLHFTSFLILCRCYFFTSQLQCLFRRSKRFSLGHISEHSLYCKIATFQVQLKQNE